MSYCADTTALMFQSLLYIPDPAAPYGIGEDTSFRVIV
jgi:hypothetical protein